MAKKAPPPMANARRIGAGSDGSSLPMATATTPPIHAARPAMLSTAHMTDDRPQVRSATARTLPPPVGEGGALRLPWRGGRSLGTWTARPDRRGALPAADGVRARGGRDRQVARTGAGASHPDRAGADRESVGTGKGVAGR